MTRNVRYTLNSDLPVTAPNSHPDVRQGIWGEGEAAGARILPSVSPTKIICVGRNYVDHAAELGNPVPEEPIIFFKPPSSLTAHLWPVVFPKLSQSVHFEGELGVIVGKRARHVSRDDAPSYIGGYTAVLDMTARDLQKKDGQWTRGKGFDTFCPAGAWWVPANEVDAASLRVRTLLNGAVKQDAPISDMIFDIPFVIEYITRFLTLEPGDLIATGTPPGVGPVQPGDRLQVEIPGVVELSTFVIAE